MKVYIAYYSNGESWEDNLHWISDKVHISKEDCVKEILNEGYTDIIDDWFYVPENDDYDFSFAKIEELELIK